MAVAYKHQNLGSTVQVVHFINERLGELKECIENWHNESVMWERVDGRPSGSVPAEVRGHTRSRQRDLAKAVSSAEQESTALTALLKSLQLCSECDGHGVTAFVDDDYTGRTRTCKRCSGSGMRM